jgi:hypothetical protein
MQDARFACDSRRPEVRFEAQRGRRRRRRISHDHRPGLEDEPLHPAPDLVGDRPAEPDGIFPLKAVAETMRGGADAEVLEILARRDPPTAKFDIAKPRQQLAKDRSQCKPENRTKLQVAPHVEIADIDRPLALGLDRVKLFQVHGLAFLV